MEKIFKYQVGSKLFFYTNGVNFISFEDETIKSSFNIPKVEAIRLAKAVEEEDWESTLECNVEVELGGEYDNGFIIFYDDIESAYGLPEIECIDKVDYAKELEKEFGIKIASEESIKEQLKVDMFYNNYDRKIAQKVTDMLVEFYHTLVINGRVTIPRDRIDAVLRVCGLNNVHPQSCDLIDNEHYLIKLKI